MADITEPIVQLLGIGLEVSGSTALTGQSSLTASILLVLPGDASLSGDSSLIADGTNVLIGSSSISTDSTLAATGLITALAESAMSAESELTAGMNQTWPAAASMSAELTLTISETVINFAIALTNGGSDLVVNATRVQPSTVKDMLAEGSLVTTMLISAPVEARPMVASSRLTATVYVPSNYLVLPTVEVAYTDNILLKRYPIDNGQTLLITDNVGTLVTFAAQQDIANADYYFRGGSTNILDDDALASVQAAGYGEYVVTQ